MNIADSYSLIRWSKLTEKENSEIRFQELRLQKLNLSSSLGRNGFFVLQNSNTSSSDVSSVFPWAGSLKVNMPSNQIFTHTIKAVSAPINSRCVIPSNASPQYREFGLSSSVNIRKNNCSYESDIEMTLKLISTLHWPHFGTIQPGGHGPCWPALVPPALRIPEGWEYTLNSVMLPKKQTNFPEAKVTKQMRSVTKCSLRNKDL